MNLSEKKEGYFCLKTELYPFLNKFIEIKIILDLLCFNKEEILIQCWCD